VHFGEQNWRISGPILAFPVRFLVSFRMKLASLEQFYRKRLAPWPVFRRPKLSPIDLPDSQTLDCVEERDYWSVGAQHLPALVLVSGSTLTGFSPICSAGAT